MGRAGLKTPKRLSWTKPSGKAYIWTRAARPEACALEIEADAENQKLSKLVVAITVVVVVVVLSIRVQVVGQLHCLV